MTILDRLADYARERTAQAKNKIPLEEIRRQAFSLPKGNFAFENALKAPDISFVCECKKRLHPKGSLPPISRICKLQRSMKMQEQTVFPY